MRPLGIFFNWLANIFYNIQRYLDNHDTFRNIGNQIDWNIGRKVYPTGYCQHCSSWLEMCFYGADKEFLKPHCCECEHPLTEKQLKRWLKIREHNLKKWGTPYNKRKTK